MKKKYFLVMTLLLFIVISCSLSKDQNGEIQDIEMSEEPIASISVSQIEKTSTESYLNTPTIDINISNSVLQNREIEFIDSITEFQEVDGNIVLMKLINSFPISVLYENIGNDEMKTIIEERIGCASVSPNHKYLGVYAEDEDKVRIFDEYGNDYYEYQIEKRSGYSKWLNNDVFMMESTNRDYELVFYDISKKNSIIINKYMELSSDISFDNDYIFAWDFYSFHKNIYDPQYTRVLYPIIDEDGINELVLVDKISNTELARFSTYYDWGNYPSWAPDNSKFSIGLNLDFQEDKKIPTQECFIIDRNGTVEYKTNLNNYFSSVYIQGMAWSTSSKYVAFYFSSSMEHQYEDINIAILDIENEAIVNFGIIETDYYHEIFWSPDEKYILLYLVNKEENSFRPMIIEVSTGKSFVLDNNYRPVGWLE